MKSLSQILDTISCIRYEDHQQTLHASAVYTKLASRVDAATLLAPHTKTILRLLFAEWVDNEPALFRLTTAIYAASGDPEIRTMIEREFGSRGGKYARALRPPAPTDSQKAARPVTAGDIDALIRRHDESLHGYVHDNYDAGRAQVRQQCVARRERLARRRPAGIC